MFKKFMSQNCQYIFVDLHALRKQNHHILTLVTKINGFIYIYYF
jgi:hypothetical protein